MSPQDDAGRAALAARAAAAVAAAHGLRVGEPAVLADAYAVRVHLRPAPVVARVSTLTALMRPPIESWLAREISVAGFLASRGAPVVAPSDLLPPGPHLKDGLALSFWRYAQPASDAPPGPEVAGRMLSELHAALREYPGELPLLAPPLNDIPRGLERIERSGALPPGELTALRAIAEGALAALKSPAGPLQPLHGDAHPGNLIVTGDGPLWNDFEDACLGPVAWDLSSLADAEGKMLAAYPGAPDPATVGLYRRARLVHVVVWNYALAAEVQDWLGVARAIFDGLLAER
jgi:hypothetical protein